MKRRRIRRDRIRKTILSSLNFEKKHSFQGPVYVGECPICDDEQLTFREETIRKIVKDAERLGVRTELEARLLIAVRMLQRHPMLDSEVEPHVNVTDVN